MNTKTLITLLLALLTSPACTVTSLSLKHKSGIEFRKQNRYSQAFGVKIKTTGGDITPSYRQRITEGGQDEQAVFVEYTIPFWSRDE